MGTNRYNYSRILVSVSIFSIFICISSLSMYQAFRTRYSCIVEEKLGENCSVIDQRYDIDVYLSIIQYGYNETRQAIFKCISEFSCDITCSDSIVIGESYWCISINNEILLYKNRGINGYYVALSLLFILIGSIIILGLHFVEQERLIENSMYINEDESFIYLSENNRPIYNIYDGR